MKAILKKKQRIHIENKKHVKSLSFREATELIYKNEGYKGFLRGLGPSLIKNSLMTG